MGPGYRPQFYVRTTDVAAEAMPGKTVQVTVAPGKPVALDIGQTSAIRRGRPHRRRGPVTALLD